MCNSKIGFGSIKPDSDGKEDNNGLDEFEGKIILLSKRLFLQREKGWNVCTIFQWGLEWKCGWRWCY